MPLKRNKNKGREYNPVEWNNGMGSTRSSLSIHSPPNTSSCPTK